MKNPNVLPQWVVALVTVLGVLTGLQQPVTAASPPNFALKAGIPLADNFESGVNGWTTTNYTGANVWHLSPPNPANPAHSWWAGIEATGTYANNQRVDNAVISPTFSLSGLVNPVLEFREKYNTEPIWDACMVDISTDGGTNWTQLRGGIFGSATLAPSGDSGGWIARSYSLSGFAGPNVKIRFYFDTIDGANNDYAGWFFDDVVVSARLTVLEDSGTYTQNNFAFDIAPGQVGQSVVFDVTTDNNALFSSPPAISGTGTLTFTPALDANGAAIVSVNAHDTGGTATNGPKTFQISVTPVNDGPIITFATNKLVVLEDAGTYSSAFATIKPGPANESSQSVTNLVTSNDQPGLFTSQPVIDSAGVLKFTPVENVNGLATVTVMAQDDGGLALGGVNQSTFTFILQIAAVNDVPSFAIPVNVVSPVGMAWTPRDSSRSWSSIASSADGSKLAAVVAGGQIYTSTDSGANWTPQASSISANWSAIASSADGMRLAAVVNGGQIFISPDAGATWLARESIRNWQSIASSAYGTKLVAVVNGGLIYTSTDSGATWVPQAAAGSRNWQSVASSADGTKLVAVANGAGGGGKIYTSTNSGVSWTEHESNRDWRSVASSGNGAKLAAVTYAGLIYTSTDSGMTWLGQPGSGSQNWVSIASSVDGTRLAAATFLGQLFLSADSGVTWTAQAAAGSRDWRSIASSADGKKLAAAPNLGQIYTSAEVTSPSVITVLEDSGAFTQNNFATSISANPSDTDGQIVSFEVTNDLNGLFSVQPAIDAVGKLTFTPAPNSNGTATVTVIAHDNGGTLHGGKDSTAPKTFIITVTPVNDPPVITLATKQIVVLEDSGPYSGALAGFSVGPPNESAQTFTVTTGNNNPGLFSAAPTVSTAGVLTFTPAANANGLATVTVIMQDTGGTANGGVDKATNTFTITVTPVNDVPSFAKGPDQTVVESSGAQSIPLWATSISPGPANESAQLLNFLVTNNSNNLFSVQPAVTPDGTLTFTVAPAVHGMATVTVRIHDNGGTDNAGVDTSVSQTFTITVAQPLSRTLWAMGDNRFGQLGDGTVIPGSPFGRPSPVPVALDVAAAAGGGAAEDTAAVGHSLFVKHNGALLAMGANLAGQLGDGTTVNRSTPVPVTTGVAEAAAGAVHSVFVKRNSTLWVMGGNAFGQLGDGTLSNRSSPVQIASAVATAAAGGGHSLFVKRDGTLWAMGANALGQLGDGTTTQHNSPVPVTRWVKAVAAGAAHSLFLKTDGTLWGMGRNTEGQLGDGTLLQRTAPVPVAGDVMAISAGLAHSLFLKTDGTLWAMGYNAHGQLGDGTVINRSTPVPVASGVSALAAGGDHSLFVKTDGSLWTMGWNAFGQLGDGTFIDRLIPVPVPVDTGVPTATVIAAAGGGGHSLFLGDAPNPQITCPGNISVANDTGKCGAKVTFAAPSVQHAPGTFLVIDPPSGTEFPVGTTPVTCTLWALWAGPPAKPVASCSFTVTVTDTEAPRFLVRPPDRLVDLGQPTTPDATGRPTATDNCTTAPRLASADTVITGGVAPVVKTIKRTWTATDAAGNQASFVQTITVVVRLALQCPADRQIECGISTLPDKTGQATATTSPGCGTVTLTYQDTSANGPRPIVKVITRTWTATDGCGNRATCQQKITVVDTTGPKILSLTATPATLTPASNLMVSVKVARVVQDSCSTAGQITSTLTVSVSDPAGPDGKTYYVIQSLDAVTLRAKQGVTYTLKLTCTDGFGNSTSKSIAVPVK